MPFKNFEEILNYAIDKEKEAVAFYAKLAKQEKFSMTKEIFESFSKEEQGHVNMLEKFSMEKIERSEIAKVPDLKRSDYHVDIKYNEGMTYPDVLILAAKREEKAYKLYKDYSEKTDNEKHKKIFQILTREELKHKLKLETILDDYMAKMGD